MPKLEQLTICYTTAERTMGYRNHGRIARSRVLIALCKVVEKYSAPVFCEHLPDLEIVDNEGRRTFWKASLGQVGGPRPGLHFTARLTLMMHALYYTVVSLFRPFYFIGAQRYRGQLPAAPRARQLTLAYTAVETGMW